MPTRVVSLPAARRMSSLEGSVESTHCLRPLRIHFALVFGVVLPWLLARPCLGERIDRPGKNLPFESGIVSVGSAHFRISIQFYLPAILFIIFDLEVVFLFAWAVAVKEAGWPGFVEISVFIFILLAALFYLWRIRALDWRTETQRRALKLLKGPGGVTNKKEFKL